MTICDAADAHDNDNDYVVAGAPQGEKGSVQGQTGVHLETIYPSGQLASQISVTNSNVDKYQQKLEQTNMNIIELRKGGPSISTNIFICLTFIL